MVWLPGERGAVLVALLLPGACSLQLSRRSFVAPVIGGAVLPRDAYAIDVRGLKVDGDESGEATRRSQLAAQKKMDEEELPFTVLDSGVEFREFREGKGEETVAVGKRVAVQLTGRLPALATEKEPGGLQFYNSKNSDILEFGFTIGSGKVVPGLEEGMLGMKKGSLRRIVVPGSYSLGYPLARKTIEPQPNGKNGQRYFDSVMNNARRDQTVIFEVLVERIR